MRAVIYRWPTGRMRTLLLGTLIVVIAGSVATVRDVSAADEPPREGECAPNPFPDTNPGPGSLKAIRPVEPTGLADYVRDRQAAIALGKALFWDMQVGSDGIQSCGTCHFRAGADPRSKNQLATGGVNNSRTVVDLGPNHQLTAANFPLHKVAQHADRNSTILQSIDDVVSSQGIKLGRFTGVTLGAEQDNGTVVPDSVFHVGGKNVRRSEPRNTPTVINAAYNRRNFWDGRADHIFNGVNPFGVRDPNARVVKASTLFNAAFVKVRIDNASLASQAVGPPLSDLEMGFVARPFPAMARRLLTGRPLAKQIVHAQDSVLGRYSRGSNQQGLNTLYAALVAQAFKPEWWLSNKMVVIAANGTPTLADLPSRALNANEFTVMEYNFTLFFGLAIQLYEMTLISDDAPIDRFFEGNSNAISALAKEGMEVFIENGCAGCHSGGEFTNASVRILNGAEGEPAEIVERMLTGNCQVGVYDQSFYNIGVRPWEEDLGIGNNDPFGNPLAIAKLLTMPASQVPSQELLTIPYPNIITNPPLQIGERIIEKGAFKVPTLRNIALTAPYFHNGGQATLKQVVQFYNRGGDFRDHNVNFIDLEIGKLNLTDHQIDAVVAFLETLTDPRVLQQVAPFDHPQLFVPVGHVGNTTSVTANPDGTAKDIMLEVPAVGRTGGPAPKAFLEP